MTTPRRIMAAAPQLRAPSWRSPLRAPSLLVRRASNKSPGGGGNEDVKGVLGGAVLGGLIAGPFGAILGSQIGGSMGANKKFNRQVQDAEENELRRMGVTREQVEQAQELANDLADAEDAARVLALDADRLNTDVNNLKLIADQAYADAEEAVKTGDDDAARSHLGRRAEANRRLQGMESDADDARRRADQARRGVDQLAEAVRIFERQIMAQKADAAQERIRSATEKASGITMQPDEEEDPLLKKFRERGMDV
ncbi:hypothetical protein PPROV_000287500 [Pycnococcus provasolii]|uniref:Uncharacterized protein n=1 Tax=Pycnococcus provasolii TaxID=41880 RepID=A0A830HET7_9CHLO|nr:hypothetical protein PPROV_000287500 [Pycnococcus provasolii]